MARAVAATAAGVLGMAAGAPAAHAAAGVAEPPAVVFTEDFEHVDTPNVAQQLNTYTGAPPLSPTYTAHPAWLNGQACNGVIASFNSSPGATGCPPTIFTTYIRGLAASMGAVLGGGNQSEVLGDVTIAGFPAPSTPAPTLQTVTPIPLPSTNRFITFGIDVGVSCQGVHPLLRFFLLDGAQAISTNNKVIDPCVAPGGTVVDPPGGLTSARVGAFFSDKAILLSSSAIGLRLTNDQTSGSGNDYAVDNIRVLDATPSLDKAFSPSRINPPGQPNATSTLTFTITNTTDLGEKAGWSFTDALPAGLTVAGPGATSCVDGVVTAQAGETLVSASGDLASGQTSCTVTVPVQGAAPGSYANGPGNVSTVGLNPPETAVLTVNQPPTVQIDGPDPDEEYFVGQDVRADYSCADADGTVTSCQGTTGDGEPVDTSTAGTHELAVTATDDDGASTTATVTYRVRPVVGLCRGTPVRALELLPATANAPETPCRTEQHSVLRVNGRVGTGFLTGDAVEGSTLAGLASARGEAHVVDVTVQLPGLVLRAQGARSRASSRLTTSCRASEVLGSSSVAVLTVNGVTRADLAQPVTIPVPGVGSIRLNDQVREGTTITQRAVFVDLPGTALDVALGESRAGVACG